MRKKPPSIRILTIREQKIVLDSDLAAVYGVTTKRLNEQFRRNQRRFPDDFAFQLTTDEFEALRSQIATLDHTSSSEANRSQTATARSFSSAMWSQIATSAKGYIVATALRRRAGHL
jgi:hypothetical protein